MSEEKGLPHNCHKVSVGERLPPEQVRNDGGEEEAGGEEANDETRIVPSAEAELPKLIT